MNRYAVVHLVAQETFKPLIGPQVVDHMSFHASAVDGDGPERVIVGLLEPARVAVRSSFRGRLAQLAARAPLVRVIGLPYISRLGSRRNAWAIAKRIRRETGNLRVVFHCRGESAAKWAVALQPFFANSALVIDVRGPWPDELLFARGYDGPDEADQRSRNDYQAAILRLRTLLARADEVFSVSPGMLEWLRDLGVEDTRLTYVPCCATSVRCYPEARSTARRKLAVVDKLVFAYLGIVASYQHVESGVIPFFEMALRQRGDAHLLIITPDGALAREALSASQIPPAASTVLTIPQEQVGETLAAADAGFLLRSPSRLTRVVQPVKLGEYLSVGVPVIVSRGAGHVDEMIQAADAGIVTDFGLTPGADDEKEVRRVVDTIARDGPALRNNAAALCARELLWAGYGANVQAAYGRALQSAEQRELQETRT